MEEWRRSSGNWEQGPNRPPKHGRPPLHPPGPLDSSVPSWEKKFCASVGISWNKLCETKSVMHMYRSVMEWDDSSALEAFQNAKARFWASINGLPCNIPLPDPDIYIDKVNYYPIIDPELVADLDKKQPAPAVGDNDANNGWDSLIYANKPVPATGWGDAEDPIPSNGNSVNWDTYIDKPIASTGWGDANNTAAVPHSSNWDVKGGLDTAWNSGNANAWNHSGGWGDGIVQNNSWGSGDDKSWDNGRHSLRDPWGNRKDEPSRRNGRKREGGAHFGLRSTKSRHQVDNYQTNNRWSNNRGGNQTNYPYEKTAYAKQPLAMW